jgi:hypothetical protein
LWDARELLRDTMIHGRFRDVRHLSVEGDEALAKLYLSGPDRPSAITVVLVNRSRSGGAEVRVQVDPDAVGIGSNAPWRWREHAVDQPARQEGSGTVARVTIPPNRVAAVEFRPS